VRGGIDEPCEGRPATVRAKFPEDEGKSADGEKNYAQDADWNVVIFRDPDVKFIFREVGDVTRERGRIVVHGLPTRIQPCAPTISVDRRVRIAILVEC